MAQWSYTTTGYSFIGKSAEQIRDICRAAGLSGIEGAPPLLEGLSDAEIESYRRVFEDAGLKISTFHLPFGAADDISSFYNTQREAAVATIQLWMERAARVGAKVGIQHPTTTRYDVAKEGMERYLGHLGKSLEVLLPAAEALGFKIALENMLPAAGGRFCSVPTHFLEIIKRFDHPALGFCLDTGHALCAMGDDAPEIQDVMEKRLAAYHLADNAGDRDSHLAPGHGRVDWPTLFRKAADSGYAGTMCIETPPFAAGPEYSLEAWKAMVDATDKLTQPNLSR